MEEIQIVLAKLVDLTEKIADETATLLNDYSSRVISSEVGKVRDRAAVLRLAASQLRKAAGTEPDKTGL